MSLHKQIFILLLCLTVGGCVRYEPAIERQLEKEHAAISAQVEAAQ